MAHVNGPSGGEPSTNRPQVDRSTKPTESFVNGEVVSIPVTTVACESTDKWLEPPDKYRWLIRDILRSDSQQLLSGRSSISSNCSAPNSAITGPTTSSSQLTTTSAATSTASSESIQIQCATDLSCGNVSTHLFVQDPSSGSLSPASTHRKPSQLRKLSYSVYDYSHRISRYIKWLDLFMMILSFFIVLLLLILLKLDPLSSSSLCLFALLWFALFILYLLVPTFKRWFLYWNPEFSILKPA